MSDIRKVPFFNYPDVYLSMRDEFVSVLDDVGGRGAFIMQSDLQEFESRLADYCGAKHAVGVANATDGIQIALMAGEVEPGDEVLFCSHTMVATASAIHFAGGKPIPVDTAGDHLIDLVSAEVSISRNTKAIMPTQLNGRTANMDAVSEFAERHGLKIFEDAAQSLGSKFKGKSAGTFGIGSAISFYPAKTLGSLGDAGAVLTNDSDVYERLLLLRDHGRGEDGDVHMWGFNTRMDNLQAAFLNKSLDKYDQVVARRRELASRYHERLNDIDALRLPPAPDEGDHFDIFQNYEIEADDRDGLKEYLGTQGVGSLIQWGGKAVHQFRHLGFDQELPKTEEIFRKLLMIPLNMSLRDEDVDYVALKIREYYDR